MEACTSARRSSMAPPYHRTTTSNGGSRTPVPWRCPRRRAEADSRYRTRRTADGKRWRTAASTWPRLSSSVAATTCWSGSASRSTSSSNEREQRMNTIARDQDTPEFQRLLKARQRVYADATRYQILQMTLTVVLPVAGAVLAFAYPEARPYVALYGLIATALDVTWVDRRQRWLLKVAAKISEEFDCSLLKMPWNSFVAGKREDAEVVDAAARRWNDDTSSIAGWYTGITPTARHSMARLVCQRMNLQYDASLRKKY